MYDSLSAISSSLDVSFSRASDAARACAVARGCAVSCLEIYGPAPYSKLMTAALDWITAGAGPDYSLSSALANEAAMLDDAYLIEYELAGEQNTPSSTAAFSRARANSALSFALSSEANIGVEALYEACHSVGTPKALATELLLILQGGTPLEL